MPERLCYTHAVTVPLARGATSFRAALGAALLVSACQNDSGVLFDDIGPPGLDTGGSAGSESSVGDGGATSDPGAAGKASGGSVGSSGKGSGGASSGAGRDAGGSGNGGAGTSGAAGAVAAGNGSGGLSGSGGAGSGGAAMGGAAGQAGLGGQAGVSGQGGGGLAGMGGGGAPATPDPVTIEITDLIDSYVDWCKPSENFGDADHIDVDLDQCSVEALLKFSLAGVPQGAIVKAAKLSLTCINPGDPITVSYAAQEWHESSVRWVNRPSVGPTIAKVQFSQQGRVSIDLTTAVAAWLGGARLPHGIIVSTLGTDGTDFASSEAADVATRPKLTVTYTPPPP